MNTRPLFFSLVLTLVTVSVTVLRADDLDITGNVITFGELNGNSTLAGATLQFQDLLNGDSSYTANFYSILAREQAQWQWLRAADSSGETSLPVMILDAQGRLNLYDPATAATPSVVPTISLAPGVQAGVQMSRLPRLELSNQTLDTDNSVVTKILGDDRYLLAAPANQSLALSNGINVNTGGSGSSNTVPANAAGIGQNLQVSSGQVVVGRNNTAATNEVFVVGAGASSTQTQNALSVSESGNTTVGGDLTVAGEAILTDVTVSGTLTVGGSQVLTQTAAASSYATQAAVTSQFATLNTQLAATYVAKSAYMLAIGIDATAGSGGWALGNGSIAGASAVSIGNYAGNNGWAASGEASVSLGYGAHGYGPHSVAVGFWNWAQGDDSVSLGYVSQAGANCSVAIGKMAQATRWGQVVVGSFNELSTSNSDGGWANNNPLPNDDLFIVGNGTSDEARSNAFIIKRNGDVVVKGALTINNQTAVTQADVDQKIETERTASNEAYYRVDQPLSVSQNTTFNGSLAVSQTSVFQKSLVVEGQRDPVEVVTNPATTKIIPKSGQVILVPEQGDISMGEFRSGPLPVANP